MTPESKTSEACPSCGEALVPAAIFVYYHCPSCRIVFDKETRKIAAWMPPVKGARRGRLPAIRTRQP